MLASFIYLHTKSRIPIRSNYLLIDVTAKTKHRFCAAVTLFYILKKSHDSTQVPLVSPHLRSPHGPTILVVWWQGIKRTAVERPAVAHVHTKFHESLSFTLKRYMERHTNGNDDTKTLRVFWTRSLIFSNYRVARIKTTACYVRKYHILFVLTLPKCLERANLQTSHKIPFSSPNLQW
jgi:hypothetical protein